MQRLPFYEFSRHKDVEILVSAGIKLSYIRMVQSAGCAGFCQYALQQLIHVIQPLRDLELAQSSYTIMLWTVGLVNNADAASD